MTVNCCYCDFWKYSSVQFLPVVLCYVMKFYLTAFSKIKHFLSLNTPFRLHIETGEVDGILTALRVCLGVLVKMLNATCVKGAGATQNPMNLKEVKTYESKWSS